ncbi:MAG: serine O-acetyltransferase [Cyanobacteria bacterium]|nr:serine O-acetyltransferase [Cyanobacteriota bacterium]
MLRDHINETIDAIMHSDPAARSRLEVMLCYPGLHAIVAYRISHEFWSRGNLTFARCLSQLARWVTGIEIHPGATIGRRLIIDHGMGVVIGETTIIGDDCFIYQGVTLGAGVQARQGEATRGAKRHPTLGNGVVVGSGAEIQGDIRIGNNVRVASGSIVLKEVPDNSIVVGVPGRVIYKDGKRVKEDETPDIEAEAIKSLKKRINALEAEFQKLVTGGVSASSSSETDIDDDNQQENDGRDPVDVFLQGAGI